jgi:hypothetical protein
LKPSLLYRGKRHEYERLEDYLERIAHHNGFSSIAQLEKFLLFHYSNSSARDLFENLYWCKRKPVVYEVLAAALDRPLTFRAIDLPAPAVFDRNKLKICPGCYKKNKAIFYYWYFESYISCHLCGIKMHDIFSSAQLYQSNYPSIKKAHQGHKNWMSVVVEKSLRDDSPASYGFIEIALYNKILWLYSSLVYFFRRYSKRFQCGLEEVSEIIQSARFWKLPVPKKYEVILGRLLLDSDVSEYELRFVAAAILCGPPILNIAGTNCFTPPGEDYYFSIDSRSYEWAISVFLEYDYSKLKEANFRFKNWHHWSVGQYLDGFDWLEQADDRNVRRVLQRLGKSTLFDSKKR